MWSVSSHPGGYGRKYRYRDTWLCRLSCWWYQPAKHAPTGTAATAFGISRWTTSRTGDEAARAAWRLAHTRERWHVTFSPQGEGLAGEQTIVMCADHVAGTPHLRWWWRCPDCDRRCGMLFLIPKAGRFTCRYCGGVTYASKQGASRGRVLARLGIAWTKRER